MNGLVVGISLVLSLKWLLFWHQLGLFVEFNPEEMMLDMEDDADLEAELAAITGEKVSAGKTKPKGKSKFIPLKYPFNLKKSLV